MNKHYLQKIQITYLQQMSNFILRKKITMIQIWPQKYLSYDMNIVAHSMYLKPNSCKSQWSPEVMYYTLPGVMVCKVSSSAGGEIHNVQWEALDKAGGANQLRYQAPPWLPLSTQDAPSPSTSY